MAEKKSKRILVTVKADLYEEIKSLAESRGVSMSTVVNLSLQSGFVALKMAGNPDFQKYMAPQDEEKIDKLVKKAIAEERKNKKDG